MGKKRRGRPVLEGSDAERKITAVTFPETGTQRGLQNGYWLLVAHAALSGDDPTPPERFAYLFNAEKMRSTILSELGRLEDPEVIREAAEIICEQKMKTVDAVAWLRRVRGASKHPSIEQLVNGLTGAVNDYWRTHPDVTREEMTRALRAVWLAARDDDELAKTFPK